MCLSRCWVLGAGDGSWPSSGRVLAAGGGKQLWPGCVCRGSFHPPHPPTGTSCASNDTCRLRLQTVRNCRKHNLLFRPEFCWANRLCGPRVGFVAPRSRFHFLYLTPPKGRESTLADHLSVLSPRQAYFYLNAPRPHFTDEDTEAHRSPIAQPRPLSQQRPEPQGCLSPPLSQVVHQHFCVPHPAPTPGTAGIHSSMLHPPQRGLQAAGR